MSLIIIEGSTAVVVVTYVVYKLKEATSIYDYWVYYVWNVKFTWEKCILLSSSNGPKVQLSTL